MRKRRLDCLVALCLAAGVFHPLTVGATDRLELALPTANDALYRDEPAAFYQFIERDFHNEKKRIPGRVVNTASCVIPSIRRWA